MDSKSTVAAMLRLVFLPLLIAMIGSAAYAHPGGLNAEGCHNNRKTGQYHCHGGGRAAAMPHHHVEQSNFAAKAEDQSAKVPASSGLPPGCFVGPRGGTYTITKSGRKNYSGC